MSWGQFHEISYQSGIEEKILGPFSFAKLVWIVPGILLANQLAGILPTLPFIDHIIFSRLHLGIPVAIGFIFAYFKDNKTNLTLFQLIVTKWKIRRRKRRFLYKRSNMPDGSELQ